VNVAVIYRLVVLEGSEVLHDVDFAAVRPADLRDILAQHPERGPNAFPERKLDARFDSPVLPVVIGGHGAVGSRFAALQATGRVVSLRVFENADHQIPVAVLENIVGGEGVLLQFSVTPAAVVPDVVVPFRRVGRRTRRAVEFVAPDKLPAAGGLRRRNRAGEQEKK